MAKGKLRRLAVIGAAIGGFVFFWRKRKGQADTGTVGGTTSGPASTGDAAG
jgi:hypothetical protein